MPDPAIEAYKAGIPYTEPTGKGIKKARVSYEYVVDPNNPSAPPRPRRVIEAGGGGGGGSGGLGKWWKGGNGGGGFKPVPVRCPPLSHGWRLTKMRCRCRWHPPRPWALGLEVGEG